MMTSSSTTIVHHENCPGCQSENIRALFFAQDHTVSQKDFEVWECGACLLRFTQDVPDEASIAAYYQSEDYISHSNTSQGLINRLYQEVRKITLSQKKKKITRLSRRKTGKLLDIGCGTGDFAGTMQAAGWEVTGLEPDGGARELAKAQHGIAVFPSDHLYELGANQFDVITMWHVLEHVHRLHESLDQIKRSLKADGLLVVAVPNYQSNDAAHYGENWAAYDVPRHLYHFSPQAMQTLMAKHGFHVERYRRMPFDSFYVSLLSEKYQHGKSRLFAGGWSGLRTYTESLAAPKRSSSILYVIRPR
jgi:2-polyprenyl-3-methyl-5-hydroxy-6-metoxy-1,4-benzoquinol methylase